MVNVQTFLTGNGRNNNKSFTINAGESVTLHFKDSGVDTATDKYYDMQKPATKVAILVDNVSTITHLNNHQLDAPITLGTDARNTFTEGFEWPKITVRADSDTTTFEVLGY